MPIVLIPCVLAIEALLVLLGYPLTEVRTLVLLT